MDEIKQRAKFLFQEQCHSMHRRTDRFFAVLMFLQWIGALAAAFILSPRAWEGATSTIHIHIWAALFLGGAITWLPVFFAVFWPGFALTRHVIAVGQMLMSALLIHLTGGRLETHFHIFGSLAFLAFYRDWRVLVTASVVVALDHYLRGVYWPQSVFGILAASPWRWLEHAFWVAFENGFLIFSITQSLDEIKRTVQRQAELENINQHIEEKVRLRTAELEISQKSLRQSEKMSAVGQLAAGVAHEINNPLGVILGFAQAVARRLPLADPLAEPLKSILRETLRCRDLVQDLLTFSRVSKIEKEPIDLNQAAEGALRLVVAQARITHIQVVKQLAVGLPPILGNHNQIQQIVVNLANNALDAMGDNGTLTMKTEFVHDAGLSWVVIGMEDTGPGIPMDIQTRIFEPFFTTKSLGKGTGLGLSLVHEIIEKHSGTIDVYSVPGRTQFRLKFPVQPSVVFAPSQLVAPR